MAGFHLRSPAGSSPRGLQGRGRSPILGRRHAAGNTREQTRRKRPHLSQVTGCTQGYVQNGPPQTTEYLAEDTESTKNETICRLYDCPGPVFPLADTTERAFDILSSLRIRAFGHVSIHDRNPSRDLHVGYCKSSTTYKLPF